MAFKTFTALNFDELECIAKEKEISEDRNELNTLLRKMEKNSESWVKS